MIRRGRLVPTPALSILLSFLFQAEQPIRTEEGVVRHVADGDAATVVTSETTKFKIRLYGIDVLRRSRWTGILSGPGQPYGEEAYRALECKVPGKRMRLQIMDVDRYHGVVAVLYLGDRDINREMVKEDYAEACKEYLHGPYNL